jgi:hypothetical protein
VIVPDLSTDPGPVHSRFGQPNSPARIGCTHRMRTVPEATVFTVDDALAQGWTRSALRNALRHGRIVRVRRGIYTSVLHRQPVIDAVAAARSYTNSVVSHRSALLMHGLPLVGSAPSVPELTVQPRTNANMSRTHVHRATLRPCDVTFVGDTPVTSVARTLTDLGRSRPVATTVAAIDAALQRNAVTAEDLEDQLVCCWNWPRIRRAQRAVRLCDGRSESPLESVSRLVLGWLGLPVPDLQTNLFDEFGGFAGRGDFYWDDPGVVGEADGRSKYDQRAVLVREKERQERLEDLGLVVVRWDWGYVTRSRLALKDRVEQAFDRGRRRDRSGFPRLWTL